jgi:hypothetical protein
MLITKEQQEAWVNTYVKEKHTIDECIGFIDGINKALEVISKKFNTTIAHSLPLSEFMNEVEYMQGLYEKQKYTQAEQVRDKLAEKLDDVMRAKKLKCFCDKCSSELGSEYFQICPDCHEGK